MCGLSRQDYEPTRSFDATQSKSACYAMTMRNRFETSNREPEVLTLTEAAALLRISVSTAKKLAREGELPGVLPKLGTQWRVSKRALDAYLSGGVDE